MKLLSKLKSVFTKNVLTVGAIFTGALAIMLTPSVGFAATLASGVAMASIETHITSSLQSISGIIHAVSILGGIAFFAAFAFKAKQHRDNPTQVTIGQPIMYLFLAIILAMLPWFITTSKNIVYGGSQKVSNWNHDQMNTLFGATTAPE